ncbi:MAG: D-alanine--D-alanine ligase [Bacteroidota bacterium]
MEKMRVGVIFGGASREREVSFAGGRTVYDNLDKNLFLPVPLFVDSFNNFVLLNWEYVYKGSIRDFYPPADALPPSANEFQVYAESLGSMDDNEQMRLISKTGTRIDPSGLKGLIDIAFLCLHGNDGEDGRIQGLLEYLKIPYTGSGILSSAIGMNKVVQKKLMQHAGFAVPEHISISREEFQQSSSSDIYNKIKNATGFPCVVKSANQGSSIGVSVIQSGDEKEVIAAIEKSLFIQNITLTEWDAWTFEDRVAWVRSVTDIREGIGMPVMIGNRVIYHPEELLSVISTLFGERENSIQICSVDTDNAVLIEAFIEGREFSCIVVEDERGQPLALPPTEIKKGKELFDYRSKYLPGLSRKITPIELPDAQIYEITNQCEKLFTALCFNVYARIDGFISKDGKVLLNDPNTTSGMMPSSFFFHQAAEIGLNPSQFITYIIRTSLAARIKDFKETNRFPLLLKNLDKAISSQLTGKKQRKRIAVLLGGFSSERHISVESGRNIYEKLASSGIYDPLPVFLTGSSAEHLMFKIPVNILLKDNADDIYEKISHYAVHPVISDIIYKAQGITERYTTGHNLEAPQRISYENLAELVDGVFIALHGRPGEDGAVQEQLQRIGLPYNGSGPASSKITIDKYQTNELLAKNGFLVARHEMANRSEWSTDAEAFYNHIEKTFVYPFICKPHDDGCSSAVKIIRNRDELQAYTQLSFRDNMEMDAKWMQVLKIKPKEEFPFRKSYMIEDLIGANGASRFLEITGGMLTSYNDQGELSYEVFEASEALSEGDILSLEEKFLAGQGQNITPARYSSDAYENKLISTQVKVQLERVARVLKVEGYARIDAFVRIYNVAKIEVVFIEVNSLPGMTPATCIFHQAAIAHYQPFEFIDRILDYGFKRYKKSTVLN